jgi:hypothetical protein
MAQDLNNAHVLLSVILLLSFLAMGFFGVIATTQAPMWPFAMLASASALGLGVGARAA